MESVGENSLHFSIDLTGEGRLQFDLSSVHVRETVLQAELHLDFLPAPASSTVNPARSSGPANTPTMNASVTAGQDHLFIYVYLIENVSPLRRRLIAKKILTNPEPGIWSKSGSHLSEVVTIRPAVLEWINRPHHNLGELICLSASPSVCLFVCVWLSGYQSVSVGRCLSSYLSVCFVIGLSACLSVCVSVYFVIYPPVCLSVFLFVCLHVCLFVCFHRLR